ncbi:MAG: hypothetical protein ACTSWL_05135 [Promethearchaeota archaeon]
MPEEEDNLDEELDDENFENVNEVSDDLQELDIGAEENESLNMDDYNYQDIDGEKESIQMSRQWYKKIDVDLWATNVHLATTGIRIHDQYRAQSRQFSKNMDVEGDVKFFSYTPEDLKKDYKERGHAKLVKDYKEIIAINKSFWEYKKKDSIIYKEAQKHSDEYDPESYAKLNRRLVVKSFSELKRDKEKKGTAGRWRGSIEESIIMSLNSIFGENRGKARPFFYITLPGYRYRLALWRTHTFVGDRYVFTLPNPKTGELTTFRIKGQRFTAGKDFKVYNAETKEYVARLNERALNIGGKVTIKFREEPEFEDLNRSVVFRRVLILFSAIIPYLKDVNAKYHHIHKALKAKRKYLKKLAKARKSKDQAKIDAINQKYKAIQHKCKMLKTVVVTNSELTMHYNPRRVRT